MRQAFFLFLSVLLFTTCGTSQKINTTSSKAPAPVGISGMTKKMKSYEGYFDFWWDEKAGKIWLKIDKLDTEFLYVNALAAGVGSNDIGLDRGQLGQSRVVKFMRSGPKVLMVEPNYDYRAVSNNVEERRSVEEAFAQSVLWGFKIERKKTGMY